MSRRTLGLAALGMLAFAAVLWAENLRADLLYSLTLHLPGVDKVLHFIQSFIVCAILGLLLARTRLSPDARVLVAAGLAVAAAGLDELQQTLRADRSIELADVGAGLSGIAVAVAAMTASRHPRAAGALVLAGFTAGGWLVADSYRRTRDFNRGILAARDGRQADAFRHYLAAVEADPRNAEAYNAAAWSIAGLGLGDPAQAVTLAARSLSLRPADANTLDTYGWALFRAGRAAEALQPLQQALAAKPDIYCIHYHLGVVYLELDRREQGIRHLQQQVTLMPDTREARLAEDLLSTLGQKAGSRP